MFRECAPNLLRHPSADEFASELSLALGVRICSAPHGLRLADPRGVDGTAARLLGMAVNLARKIDSPPRCTQRFRAGVCYYVSSAFLLGLQALHSCMLDDITSGVGGSDCGTGRRNTAERLLLISWMIAERLVRY